MRTASACCLLTLIVGAGCHEPEGPIDEASPAAGFAVTASVSSVIAGTQIHVAAQLVDANGAGISRAGDVVTWSSTGGGTFATPTSQTNADGRASVFFSTSTTPGTTHTIAATNGAGLTGAVAGITTLPPPVVFAVTVSSAAVTAGATVTVTARITGAAPPTGAAVVRWSATGDGTFAAPTSATAGDGVATVTFATSSTPGVAHVITATDANFSAPPTGAAGVVSTTGMQLTSVAAGGRHACGLDTSGAAYCWGNNGVGQMGDGTRGGTRLRPVSVTGGLRFTHLAAGEDHTCGIATGGRAYCWGAGYFGQLGNGGLGNAAVYQVPTPVFGELSFVEIAAGASHTCGVVTGGGLYCWGDNIFGQIGDGGIAPRGVPMPIAQPLAFQSVAGGWAHTCAVTTAGAAQCWGLNVNGQLGDGTMADRGSPAPVPGLASSRAIGASFGSSCALTVANTIYCWGTNSNGNLGSGVVGGVSTSPVATTGGYTFQSMSSGRSQTCAIASDRRAYCWGNSITGNSSSPRSVSGHAFQSVSASNRFACGILVEGGVLCWGANAEGQLGDGTRVDRLGPVWVWLPE